MIFRLIQIASAVVSVDEFLPITMICMVGIRFAPHSHSDDFHTNYCIFIAKFSNAVKKRFSSELKF